ncbi:hypothetical protein Alsa3_CDS0105 [Staphylococcus phage Alsa_3]|nr:hypothetical protein Alsa3_CDS0105 [Staphylococcus phage Alsa_3]WNM51229.1 hypothetical protein Alsa4_CDS0099 [Staphylococcus phage Alsa_4]
MSKSYFSDHINFDLIIDGIKDLWYNDLYDSHEILTYVFHGHKVIENESEMLLNSLNVSSHSTETGIIQTIVADITVRLVSVEKTYEYNFIIPIRPDLYENQFLMDTDYEIIVSELKELASIKMVNKLYSLKKNKVI